MHAKRKTGQSMLINILRVKVPPRSENDTTLKVTPISIDIKCTRLAHLQQVMIDECVVEDNASEELEGRKQSTDDLSKGI